MTASLRIVFLGSGSPISTAALRAVAARFTVAAVVVPAARRPGATVPLMRVAEECGVRVLHHHRGRDEELAVALAAHAPDLACVASYPWLLRAPLLACGRRGAIGLHSSLLPRHRGPDPLFWTYLQDDAEAGVTTFWLDDGEDTGDVILQEPIPLPRGLPGMDLYGEVARRGAALLARTLEQVEAGTAPRRAQEPATASREPAPKPGTWSIDFATWSAERVWHVLRGVGWRADALRVSGRPVGRARRYVLSRTDGAPGTLRRSGGSWRLSCRDGFVELDPPPWMGRLRVLLRRWLPARR